MNAEPSFDPVARPPGVAAGYWGFLSYSHRDRAWADWLHRALESYRVPNNLVGTPSPNGPIPARLVPIFRDRDELAASDDLGSKIRAALAASRCLILLCSPAAATSRWTNEEVLTFRRLHPGGRVLAAILAGEPFASEIPGREAEECFPPSIRRRVDLTSEGEDAESIAGGGAEPVAADFRDGGDGRRMGFLKLVAGMLDVGLDALIQREAQRRQRRLKWIAAASLAGMAFTSGLAIVAFDARDEARDQRAQAEGLVSYMLGDLRKELEPLGRLDLLDSVGARALDYYRAQDRGSLTTDALLQQARALTLIGEIANVRGDLDGALQRYREAYAGTAEALRRAPDDQQRLFDHGQNIFWIGYIAWQRGDLASAETAFREYKQLALRLETLDPAKPEWRLEGIYADTNLGTLLLQEGHYAPAARTFHTALDNAQRLASAAPADLQYREMVSESLANLADAQEGQGLLEDAIASRKRQFALLGRMRAAAVDHADIRRAIIPAARALGRLLAAHGDTEAALRHLRLAAAAADDLRRRQPDNMEWLQNAADAHVDHGELLVATGQMDAASLAIRSACEIARTLVARDATVVAWTEVMKACLVTQAEAAARRGAHAEALALASRAIALSQPPGRRRTRTTSWDAVRAAIVKGDALAALGDRSGGVAAWTAALAALPAEAGAPPSLGVMRYRILRRLGREDEAALLAERLDGLGYRHPTYLAERRKD